MTQFIPVKMLINAKINKLINWSDFEGFWFLNYKKKLFIGQ